MSKAACADLHRTSSGSVTPRSARAQSRYVLTAMMMLSVPPDVIVPHVSGPPWNIAQHICTTSASILRTKGNTSGCSGFETAKARNASTTTSVASSPPW